MTTKPLFVIGLLATIPFYIHQSNVTAGIGLIGILTAIASYISMLIQESDKRKEERKMILKRLLMCVAILAMAGMVQASPFTVSDPEPTAIGGIFEIWQGPAGLTTTAQVETQATMIAVKAVEADGSIRYDMANIQKGTYYWYVRYGQSWGTYGTPPTEVPTMTYSPFVDFTFTKKSNAIVGTKAFKIVQ